MVKSQFPRSKISLVLVIVCIALVLASRLNAATFNATASVSANDTTNALSADPVNNLLTVSCWFRIVVPTGVNVTEDMTILMDRTDGDENANHSYHLRFNASNGNVEFVTRGLSGDYTNTLIKHPFLDRWYHVAVTRNGNNFSSYVDGRALNSEFSNVGSAVGSGLSFGGINGASRLFRGDVIEVAIYRSLLNVDTIRQRMFLDQRTYPNLAGYYKLGYSTNSTDLYRNFVPVPPAGSNPATKQGSGTIEFEETDQAGEQSTFDSRRNGGEQAIAPLSGAYSWSRTLLSRPVPGVALDFRFGYSSALPTQSPAGGIDPYSPRRLSPGWRNTFDARIFTETSLTEFKLLTWSGGIETWVRTNSSAPFRTRHNEYRGELLETNGGFEWTTPDRIVYRFQDPTDGTGLAGRLKEIRDFNGNKMQLFWDDNGGDPYLTSVLDTVNGHYSFNYDTARGLLTNVSFGQWQVNFGYDATNRLISKAFTNTSAIYSNVNATIQFGYDTNGLLNRTVDARGFTNIILSYDRYSRVTNQTDAIGRGNRIEYGVPDKRQIRRTDAAGFQWLETYDRKGRIILSSDPLGNASSFRYDEFGNRTYARDPLGYTKLSAYDSRANLVARTNELGEVTRWEIHQFFNKPIKEINALNWTNRFTYNNLTGALINHSDDLGTLVSYAYYSNGLIQTETDPNGRTTTISYDSNGFPNAKIDPGTNTTLYSYNEVGWKVAETNALGQVRTYKYDINGNIVLSTDSFLRQVVQIFDPNKNLLRVSDAKAAFTQYAYDPANQRTQMVDRASNTWRYAYTARGQPSQAVDPLGNSVLTVYDAAKRRLAVTNELGFATLYAFDANGNEITMIDRLGRQWTKTYDRLNRVIANSDPLGNTHLTRYDMLGRTREAIAPCGNVTSYVYDGRGRLVLWTDSEGFPWQYNYDSTGNITNITDALGGKYVMRYGPRNERLSERNQDGFEWNFVYDPILRVTEQRDPNGLVRNISYDDGNRVDYVTFSTGRVDDHSYDDNDNLIVLSRSKAGQPPTTSTFVHDTMDRVVEYTDTFSKKVKYTYDTVGRTTILTYPGNLNLTYNYDAAGRPTNLIDWAGHQMNFGYDPENRLTRRVFPNGVVQTNAYDIANRMTKMVYAGTNSPSLLELTYAFDCNGNKVSSTESGTLNWPTPTLTDEVAAFTAANRITTVQQLSPTNLLKSYNFDSTGNATNVVGAGQIFNFAYDEDNRVAKIFWDSGLTSKTITNRYDTLGRRISRWMDGVETRYVLDLSGKMDRILCDTAVNGQVTAYYIHAPDLCYRIDAASEIVAYHSDAQANIIATTDSSAQIQSQYAYTPYGRSLGSSNSLAALPNPFRFVGSQGAMEELPNLYFMRARYYSADIGLFLSTDPVKPIGPSWKPVAYLYAEDNPLTYTDASGLAAECGPAGHEYELLNLEGIGNGPGACTIHDRYIDEHGYEGKEREVFAQNSASAVFWVNVIKQQHDIISHPLAVPFVYAHDAFVGVEILKDFISAKTENFGLNYLDRGIKAILPGKVEKAYETAKEAFKTTIGVAADITKSTLKTTAKVAKVVQDKTVQAAKYVANTAKKVGSAIKHFFGF